MTSAPTPPAPSSARACSCRRAAGPSTVRAGWSSRPFCASSRNRGGEMARDGGENTAGGGNAGHALEAGDVGEGGVAAEEVVAADAGDGHFELLLGRGFADEPGVRAVDGRLVHGVEELREVVEELV